MEIKFYLRKGLYKNFKSLQYTLRKFSSQKLIINLKKKKHFTHHFTLHTHTPVCASKKKSRVFGSRRAFLARHRASLSFTLAFLFLSLFTISRTCARETDARVLQSALARPSHACAHVYVCIYVYNALAAFESRRFFSRRSAWAREVAF